MITKTKMFVDNTTFAAAGRVLYDGDLNTEGGAHAEYYYGRYKDARDLDRLCFLEFLTALLLFDQLLWWNGSSIENEDEDLYSPGEDLEVWTYSWFPVFKNAKKNHNAISEIYRLNTDKLRLEIAREVALRWVSKNFTTFHFPRGFKVPAAYKDKEYRDLPPIRVLQKRLGLNLSEEELQLAMFLQRGLFYQSESLQDSELSYLPHSYRACLVSHPEIASLSMACTKQIVKQIHPIGGDMLMQEIGSVFKSEVVSTFGGSISMAEAIVAPFLINADQDPKNAFEAVLDFRKTQAGKDIRKKVRELITLGNQANLPGIKERLRSIRKSLQTVQLRNFGYNSSARKDGERLLGMLGGNIKFVLKSLWDLIPLNVRERVSKILNISINPTGFQVVFSHYFN
jgi:hypothetical protein